MDSQTKTANVYLQSHKAGKKWKPVWLSLFPPSSSAVGRLEIQTVGGGGVGGDYGSGVKRHHQPHGDRKPKVVRLSELISVLRLPPNAEACPKDNMSAFCVETQDRTMVFAALKDECVDWVETLCHNAFQRGGGSGSNQFHMEENQIYASADEVQEFWVVIQRTDAATRCGLQGSYWLQVGQQSLLLRDTQKKIIREWPYELLRRYGKDKLALTIEAGRRCDSGPGTFTFETQQAEKLFSLIQSTIKRKSSSATLGNQNQEGENVVVMNIQAHSPLPKIPDMTSMAALLENQLWTQERKPPASEKKDLVGQSECKSAEPTHITLMPLPQVPTHDSPSGGPRGGQSDPIYADPADCIQPALKPQSTTALYVDPAGILPLIPPGSREPVTALPASSEPHPCLDVDVLGSVYSEVYDKISPVHKNPAALQSKGKIKCFSDEPIYTEPTSEKDKVAQKFETKPDQFAHLYAQVCKAAPSSGTTSASSSSVSANRTTKATDESLDDVIYENLGII